MTINKVNKIDDLVIIQRVLISVSDKSGLETFVPALINLNPKIEFFSTGGTFQTIREILGHDTKRLIQVSDYTGQPETQGGLVKTLDFKIYLGLLTETYNLSHQADLTRTHAVAIDMVVVNLYPFQQTVARANITLEDARGNIDIGGPCMIRASAKNFLRVASVVTPADYGMITANMAENGGGLTLRHRFALAQKAFTHTANYDLAIAEYLSAQIPAALTECYNN